MEFYSKDKKFKKYHKLKYKVYNRYPELLQGNFGLQILKTTKVRVEHLSVCIKILKKLLKNISKKAKFLLKIYPDFSVTKKPKDIRMGRGKGLNSYKIYNLKAGTILFEIIGLNTKNSKKILTVCATKLPNKTNILYGNLNKNLTTAKQWLK